LNRTERELEVMSTVTSTQAALAEELLPNLETVTAWALSGVFDELPSQDPQMRKRL